MVGYDEHMCLVVRRKGQATILDIIDIGYSIPSGNEMDQFEECAASQGTTVVLLAMDEVDRFEDICRYLRNE